MRFSFFITAFLLLILGSLAVRQRDERHSNTPSRKSHAGTDHDSRASLRAPVEKTHLASNRADRLSKRGASAQKPKGGISGSGVRKTERKKVKKPDPYRVNKPEPKEKPKTACVVHGTPCGFNEMRQVVCGSRVERQKINFPKRAD
ncbi:unnamed protein product [Clonostachys rosea]|uniref:Secreted protein n=1 Tax=Bionectria ochroleuca TaxID=29856 RepID=A0ABY6U6L1_BIOOC|nr:unnamed protein product [Clonostachys rosea]